MQSSEAELNEASAVVRDGRLTEITTVFSVGSDWTEVADRKMNEPKESDVDRVLDAIRSMQRSIVWVLVGIFLMLWYLATVIVRGQ